VRIEELWVSGEGGGEKWWCGKWVVLLEWTQKTKSSSAIGLKENNLQISNIFY